MEWWNGGILSLSNASIIDELPYPDNGINITIVTPLLHYSNIPLFHMESEGIIVAQV